MKAGRFFQIPEKPSELWNLWKQAQLLSPDRLPHWLTCDDAPMYRLLGGVSSTGLSAADKAALKAEIDEMELARLIVANDPRESDLHSVYIELPPNDAIWSIGVYQGRSPLELAPAPVPQPVLTADHVTDVAAVIVADPFWIRDNGRWYMFFEVLNWKANKGEIGLATSDDGLHWRYEQIVLAEEFHLSYPYVMATNDGIYMVPESFQDNSVRLYRAKRFPYEWECVGTLLSGGYFVDSSPFCYNDSWWLFTESGQETDDTLRLFFADRLEGPWREHPRSPIVSGNPTLSRPAGRVLVLPQKIMRFAQNCSSAYGVDVRAIDIVRLTKTEYHETASRIVAVLGPSGHGWNASGMHHVDLLERATDDWLALVDGWHSYGGGE